MRQSDPNRFRYSPGTKYKRCPLRVLGGPPTRVLMHWANRIFKLLCRVHELHWVIDCRLPWCGRIATVDGFNHLTFTLAR